MIDKLKIGFLTYTVEDFEKKEADVRGVYGTHNSAEQKIKIDKNISKERYKETLLHELLHACWNQWVTTEGDMKEEDVVCALAIGLATVFKDNPELKKILF